MAPKPDPDRLQAYRGKRNFTRTAEPVPELAPEQGWRFVVQKHDARRLHYDLRLELDGVLLSWALPHGPSLVATDKRLAVRTEDHPKKYLDFEGVIPKGEYGGGTMIVWDQGIWTPAHDPRTSLEKGHLEFVLAGERLKGRWHLVRIKPRAREKTQPWLLIKANDEFERRPEEADILEEATTSVLSGCRNEDLEEAAEVRVDHARRTEIAKTRAVKAPDARGIKGARRGLLELFIEPCLASAADRPPPGSRWLHEVKFDGYRLQARIDGDEIRLLTRKGLDWTERFGAVALGLRQLGLGSAILDGEIVVEDGSGISSFNALVAELKAGRQDRFRYYLFDLLYLNGMDVRNAALADRKALLAEILASAPPTGRIALSEPFDVEGSVFFEHAGRLGLEGIVSKRRDQPYRSGRDKDWIKSKCVLREEFVVIGFVPSTTARRAIGSRVLGFYEEGQLIHAGRVGSGFGQEEAAALYEGLDQTRTEKPAFGRKPTPEAAKGVRWVEPRLVVEVEYHGWTLDGVLWHATFRGLRQDKEPHEIVRENPAPSAVASGSPTPSALTHPDRLLWAAEGITKQGLADFYTDIAERILPHLAGRPLSLVRCPGGVEGASFYAKHAWAGLSDAVRRVDAGEGDPSLIVDDLAGLLALVQGNVLEIHPWGATTADLERPDRLIFDLDPDESVAWTAVVEAAREVRERLKTGFALDSFVKTTGGKGLHVVVPLVPALQWEPAKALCRQLAEAMAGDSPTRYVAIMSKEARSGRIFIDYVRNGRGATAVAAYSTRARAGATVSVPLAWEELSDAVKSDHYRIGNLQRRLAYLRADPWAGFFQTKQRLADAALRRPSGKRARRE